MTPLCEGRRLGPYRIVRLLGEGGMGAVYEARQDPLDRRVAIKILHPEYAGNKEAVARFFNEAKVLTRLEHPSLVQVSDFGNAPDGTAYLVMEYLRGQSLGQRLSAEERRLPVVTVLQLGWQVADVLAVAHAQGVVHRDLKPDNLMLVADPIAPGGERVKILDFGIAKLTGAADLGGAKTDTRAVMGTPLYMSPEQCGGAGGVDAKTDVYSLGCVLYEAMAGRPPFVAEGAGQLIGMHLFQTPPALLSVAPKVPPQVAVLVHLLLSKDKVQRPSMSDAADEIGRLLSRMSGGGAVVRSRSSVSTDPDATRPIDVFSRPFTTLGQSAGQRSKAGIKDRLILAVSLSGLAIVGALAAHTRFRGHRSPSTAVAQQAPLFPTAPNATPSPAAAVPAPTPIPATIATPTRIPSQSAKPPKAAPSKLPAVTHGVPRIPIARPPKRKELPVEP